MTRDDIIRMAREADLLVTTPIPDDSVFVADLERFAHLVAAAERQRNLELVEILVEAEREACAMEADYEAARWAYSPEAREPCEEVAKAIRAREEK
jgi:hypothetical protein